MSLILHFRVLLAAVGVHGNVATIFGRPVPTLGRECSHILAVRHSGEDRRKSSPGHYKN